MNINLCELLKGHEGETFYSPLFGDVIFEFIDSEFSFPIHVITNEDITASFAEDGKYVNAKRGECMLFPSKDQHDWNKWIEEQNKKPKTWAEFVKHYDVRTLSECINHYDSCGEVLSIIVKPIIAFYKIYQLISTSYGGIPTTKERFSDNGVYVPAYINDGIWQAQNVHEYTGPIAFHTREQCIKFLSYLHNIELLKDFYTIWRG